MASAVIDHGIRPARKVVELAEAGRLPAGLPAFKVQGGPATVRQQVRDERNRRAGVVRREIARKPPRDAVEDMRQRLVSVVDLELARMEKRQKNNRAEPINPEYLRQLARAAREVAALPGPDDTRPLKPGDKTEGKREAGATTGGLAARILNDHARSPVQTDAAQDAQPNQTRTEIGNVGTAARENESATTRQMDSGPGAEASVRSLVLPVPAEA